MPWWRASKGSHPLDRLRARLAGARLPIWYSPDYRLPLAGIAGTTGIEPRRADLAIWYLLGNQLSARDRIRVPVPIPYRDVARVHTPELLESLHDRSVLANIFASTTEEIIVDEVLRVVRLACGGTLAAAREARRRRGPALNLLGGFHHAGPARGGGLCPINDIAIAIAVLRAEGCIGHINILDLDAHPPDGTAECLVGDDDVWIGSISGTDWGPLPGDHVDETVLTGADDDTYLAHLDALLRRMPSADLAFVLAGGDVLACDRMGGLGLTLDGARARDLRVAEALGRTPAVWVPAGGYNKRAWRVLAGTAIALEIGSRRPIPDGYDPLRARYAYTSHELSDADLGFQPPEVDEFGLGDMDFAELLGFASAGNPVRFLDFYTAEGIELALERFGVLAHLRRLGYDHFRLEFQRTLLGDSVCLYGTDDTAEHRLMDCAVGVQELDQARVLFVHRLSLTNPRAHFDASHPRLPDQEQPGLGLAREAVEMLGRIAKRLDLDGVAFRPSWYHLAYAARYDMAFVDPVRQGRFEALMRDLEGVSLLEATLAVDRGGVLLDGEPYRWEPDVMVYWRDEARVDRDAVDAARQAARFELVRRAG